MKKSLVVLVIMSLLTLLIVACSSGDNASATLSSASSAGTVQPTATTAQPNTVHMNASQFLLRTITIKKGQSVTLIDDTQTTHVVANGTWMSNGTSKYAVEAGAPKVDVQFNGDDSHTIGPFNTAGTFHLYCTVHQGMSLTVVVQ